MSIQSRFTIAPVVAPDELAAARVLFIEYVGSLGSDLALQEAEAELAELPGKYAAPSGIILIARDARGQPQGCCALRPLEARVCELKRLYVRPAVRGFQLGRLLAEATIAYARTQNYSRLLLDTLPDMRAAHRLYGLLGFRPTASPGAIFLELNL